jgi:GntR family transcriptional regulator
MYIDLDYQSGEPIYQQIVEQVKYQVACSELKPGDKLPTIRDLARQLKINPRTVVKAYEELQAAGLVVRRQGSGVFIKESQAAMPIRLRHKAIEELAKRLWAEALRMGASGDEVLSICEEVLEKMRADQ